MIDDKNIPAVPPSTTSTFSGKEYFERKT